MRISDWSSDVCSSDLPIAIDGGKSLSIRRAEDCARFSLRIAVEHAGEAAAAFGCDLPRAIGGMTSSAGKLALCLGPDEWQLMAPAGQEDDITRRFDALYAQVPHSLVDIGHRETGIEIGGSSEERRVGKAGVSTGRYRWAPEH